MPIAPGDTIRVTFLGTCFAQRILIDLSYLCTVGNATTPTNVALQELLTQVGPGGLLANRITTSYLACLPPQYTLNELRAQVIRPIRSAYSSNFIVGITGTNINPATVACDSAAVTRRTPLAGRNQISTLKVGPCPDGASAAGMLTVPYGTLIQTFGSDTIKGLLLPVSTIQLVPVILNRFGLDTGRVLTNFVVGLESRVMRRRVVGRGI